jgi:Thaumatin family
MANRRKSRSSKKRTLSLLPILLLASSVAASHETFRYKSTILPRTVSPRVAKNIPLKITNKCAETIWPGIASQTGTGPDTGGFELKTGTSKDLTVGGDWQGRVWGRTNCTFNAEGSGASNLNGNNGGGQACQTGDCNGVLSCVVTVSLLPSSAANLKLPVNQMANLM